MMSTELKRPCGMKEKTGAGKVTLVCMGPARASSQSEPVLPWAPTMPFHLDDAAFDGSDPLATAKALAAQIKKMQYDVIFCGTQAIDDDQSQVGVALAENAGYSACLPCNQDGSCSRQEERKGEPPDRRRRRNHRSSAARVLTARKVSTSPAMPRCPVL